LLARLGDRIAERAEAIAAIETRENGKLYKEMLAQLHAVPDWLAYYGGLADKIEGRVIPLDRQSVLNYTLREPLGVVGVITPWNSPVLLTIAAVAPAVAAGNTVVVKPSEFASAGVLEMANLVEEAGLPSGAVNVVTGGRAAGEALIAHPRVAKISFTGGTETGRRIAQRAGHRLARFTLELGGKSANIVFADADLEAAEAGVLAGIYGATGQTCIAGSRALIERPIYDELVARLVRRAQAIKLGDPMDAAVEMGPIATQPQLERIETHVDEAQRQGATVLCGGALAHIDELPRGLFFQPTILANLPVESTAVQEEIFGPVLVVAPFDEEDEAVELANATQYGLAAGVWTLNVKRAHLMARRLQAGTVWINRYRGLAFNSPFGGYKRSGIGRLGGLEAIDEFLQTKSVWCELSEDVQSAFLIKF
jgi:aldehyde dehydrogenase (NAD+)